MLAVLLVATLLPAPQGPGTVVAVAPRTTFGYPDDPGEAFTAPFRDAAGAPQRIATGAAGAADLDGDGNADAWFLAGAGPRDGDLELLSAHTADLGRFVPYGAVTGGGFRAAVTFRRAGVADTLLLADPTTVVPQLLFYQPGLLAPRAGTFVVQPTIWPVGLDMFALATLDPDGDGHDDLVALRELRVGGVVVGTEVVRLHFGMGSGGHQVLSTARLSLPVVADRLRAADLDGDGSTDAVLHLPGLGIVALRIDAQGAFTFHSALGLTAGSLVDLTVADFDDDGRDDWVGVLANGCLVARSLGAQGTSFLVALRPAALTVQLAGARAIDGDGDGTLDLVAIPASGGVLAVHPFDPTTSTFADATLRLPPAVPELTSTAGIAGTCAVDADLDGDGDLDLLLQLPTGDRWLGLHATSRELTPQSVTVSTVGAPSAAGFVVQRFTIDVPADLFADGFTDLEVGVFVQDPRTGEPVFWDREIVQPDPVTRRVVLNVQAMLDPVFADWLWNGQITRHPQTGEMTAFGPTVVTIHGKSSTRRARSTLVRWDGQGDPHSSAVGVRWRVVAAPPLPKTDAQLLPWD